MDSRPGLRICFVLETPWGPSETFIKAQADGLPGQVILMVGPSIDGRPLIPRTIIGCAWCKARRILFSRTWEEDLKARYKARYLKAFVHHRPHAVLAHYGPTGVIVDEPCRRAGIPLIVHFHGYDASQRQTLLEHKDTYPVMFRYASGIVAVSRAMRKRLIELGAPPDKVFLNPCGVDCSAFCGSDPSSSPPSFMAVGRFVEKKAPHLTILAFAEVHRSCPEARLRMIGFGPLLDSCVQLAQGLGIAQAVEFLGSCPPHVVQQEMRRARCFVQHSVVAPDGDSEGTPVAILEAGASGLPVVSTRHAGIPDVVIEGMTGFLVEEGDVPGMARGMLELVKNPGLARELGRAARERIESEFALPKRIDQLRSIIDSCVTRNGSDSV